MKIEASVSPTYLNSKQKPVFTNDNDFKNIFRRTTEQLPSDDDNFCCLCLFVVLVVVDLSAETMQL